MPRTARRPRPPPATPSGAFFLKGANFPYAVFLHQSDYECELLSSDCAGKIVPGFVVVNGNWGQLADGADVLAQPGVSNRAKQGTICVRGGLGPLRQRRVGVSGDEVLLHAVPSRQLI